MEFCREAGAGGNHLVAVTASGRKLGDGKGHRGHVLLRERELAPLLAEFKAMPKADRQPVLPDPRTATPPKRPVPSPPEGGLILRGFCTYMKIGEDGQANRAPQYYYKENPDAWAAETQSDMLWLTEAEWRSLIPAKPKTGTRSEVETEIGRRLFCTLGIDYMEGSVNALRLRESQLSVTPTTESDGKTLVLAVDGSAKLGREHDGRSDTDPKTRGCEISVAGRITYDRKAKEITSFDLAGIGRAWGNKMEYTRRAIRIEENPWTYGIAVELVTGDSPYDLVPPYNLLHYGGGMKYFGGE